MFRKFSIQSKIVFPYTFLFAAVIVATAIVTIAIFHRQMDKRFEKQMKSVAESIGGFLLSDEFLRNIKIKEVIGADIIVYEGDGFVTATTLDRDIVDEAMLSIRSADIESSLAIGKSVIRDVSYLGAPHKILYRRLSTLGDGGGAIAALIFSTSDIALANRDFRMIIGVVALSGILLVAVVGSIIARSITAPVKQLVDVTEQIAAGDLDVAAAVKTSDEIGALAGSINQMTRELKASRDRLVQSEKMAAVGNVAAAIAHEIRNPLTSVKMIVQLLRRRFEGDDSGLESVQAVLDEISRLEVIINDLLDFARPMELHLDKVNVTHVINSVLKFMEADLRHRKIGLINQMDESLPAIMLDGNRMKQVFMNLILNAMQAMPEGGKLTISCSHDDENQAVRVSIADDGIGMSQEVLDSAFEPFFSTKTGGAGLGLANVKRIVEQHGGNINVESVENQGTKVIIELDYRL